MKKELDDALCKKYPKIFRDRHAPMSQTCMCWGLEVGGGWYNIIDIACSLIQSHIDHTRKNRASSLQFNRAMERSIALGDNISLVKFFTTGTDNRAKEWATKMAEASFNERKFRKVGEACPQVVASQIKEKFGTLRFYVNGGDEFTSGAIAMAEDMSAVTCEECGAPGKVGGRGWASCKCDEHRGE